MDKFSQQIPAMFERCKNEAIRHNSAIIGPEHFLLTMLSDIESREFKLVDRVAQGRSAYELYRELDEALFDMDCHKTVKLALSDVANRVMKLSMLEARILKDPEVEPVHILLTLFRNNEVLNMPFIKPFIDAGVTYRRLHSLVAPEDTAEAPAAGAGFAGEDEEEAPKGTGNNSSRNTSRKNSRSTPNDTPMLDKFGHDLTRAAAEGQLDPVVGREVEIERLAQILSRRKKNNPVLIGEPGVGKSAIVEGLSLRIVQRKVSRILFNKRVISLDMAAIVAGTKYRGEFEERIKAILDELQKNKDIILFIDEIHTIVGAGNPQGSMDAANLLKPALARGELQCIGATTLDEYRKNIEKDGALERRFQKVMVDPTSPEETLIILNNIKDKYEKHHNVTYTDDAIEACVKLTERYVSDRNFPDKAIDALDEAGSRVHITNVEVPEEIDRLEKAIEEANQNKLRAAQSQNFESAAAFRDKAHRLTSQLEEAKAKWEEQLSSKRVPVDEDKVAEVVAMMTGVPVQRIAQAEGKRLKEMAPKLKADIIGQDSAIEKIVKAIQRNRIGLKDPNKPIGTFMFLGPTGVGKTHLAKKLSEYLFDNSDSLIRIDMSEYMEKFTVSRLVGAPPGYVGYEEGGQLTEAVRRHPYSVVLLDEIEKAHPDVFNLLLQMMDEGRLTDSLGRHIDFKNVIIIMTSNIGTRQLKDFGSGVGFNTKQVDKEYSHTVLQKALNKAFSPEFLNRIDDIIMFDALDKEAIFKIIDIELAGFYKRVADLGYTISISEDAKTFIAEKGYDSQFGARPLKRAIQKYLEDELAELIIGSDLSAGDKISVEYDSSTAKIVTSISSSRQSDASSEEPVKDKTEDASDSIKEAPEDGTTENV